MTQTQTTSQPPESALHAVNAFDILSADGSELLGTYNAATDPPQCARESRVLLNSFRPGSYWLISARRGKALLQHVTADDARIVTVPVRQYDALSDGLSDFAKLSVLKTRRELLLRERVPESVADIFLGYQRPRTA